MSKRILLTGATGFVGQYLYPALVAAGFEVRCATRKPQEARKRFPGRDWVEFDVERPETIGAALSNCAHAFYLIHGMAGGGDYPEREARSARNFLCAAREAGTQRVIYLGGVLPASSRPSKHLASRQRTGEILRSGDVDTIELRAAMIIGEGSTSWTMVRDLAARLPAMVLPRWLRNRNYRGHSASPTERCSSALPESWVTPDPCLMSPSCHPGSRATGLLLSLG
jgi:uncharacterized protein YbjT (DUF2867 family)